jgi:hypothetical protein
MNSSEDKEKPLLRRTGSHAERDVEVKTIITVVRKPARKGSKIMLFHRPGEEEGESREL